MEWEVLDDKVLVQRDETETEKGGLAVPDKAQKKQSQGTVVKVGPGVLNNQGFRVPLTVLPGDRVRFTAFSGVPLDEDDESLILLREAELLAYSRNGV